MSFNEGEMVGPYRVVEQLGQGGMATVYKAYHAALDRYVAIKVLHPAFLQDASFLSRFQREARLVAKLEHPNIVPIYDYAEHEGRPYLVMKFIEGETLKARLSRGPIDPDEIAYIVDKVGAALSFAHKNGILHRDIKPSNVLLTGDNEIYLADFGLARIAQSGDSTLTTDMILGTPQYISPEQALGKKDLDAGTDIYSFGVMLYELTVGKVPFSADTPFSVIHDHIYSPLPMPRQVNPQVSEDLERVLLKALSKERHDRYKDVHAMLDAFRQAWQLGPIPKPEDKTNPAPAMMQETLAAFSTVSAIPVPSPAAETLAPVQSTAVERLRPEPVEGPHPDTTVKAARPKRRFPWMWSAVAVILITGCLYTFIALRSTRWQDFLPQAKPLPPASNFIPTNNEPALATVPASVSTQMPGGLMTVAQAEQVASQNPNDPAAQLQLALAYWNENLTDAAQGAVSSLEKLANGNEQLLWESGGKLAAANAWLPAARLYVDAAALHVTTTGSLSDEMTSRLHEAIYKAFKDKGATAYIPYDRLDALDKPISTVANARNTFYYGDKVKAQGLLNQLMQSKPSMPEAQLLNAEFAAANGKPVAARQALKDLRNNSKALDWMLNEAKNIEGTLP
jgi:serine/threonine protein kinase